jgi:hypothetical protein
MPSSGMLRRVALVENRRSSETSVLTSATRRNIPENGILPRLPVRKRTIPVERPHVWRNLLPTFTNREVSRGQCEDFSRPLNSVSYNEVATLSFK